MESKLLLKSLQLQGASKAREERPKTSSSAANVWSFSSPAPAHTEPAKKQSDGVARRVQQQAMQAWLSHTSNNSGKARPNLIDVKDLCQLACELKARRLSIDAPGYYLLWSALCHYTEQMAAAGKSITLQDTFSVLLPSQLNGTTRGIRVVLSDEFAAKYGLTQHAQRSTGSKVRNDPVSVELQAREAVLLAQVNLLRSCENSIKLKGRNKTLSNSICIASVCAEERRKKQADLDLVKLETGTYWEDMSRGGMLGSNRRMWAPTQKLSFLSIAALANTDKDVVELGLKDIFATFGKYAGVAENTVSLRFPFGRLVSRKMQVLFVPSSFDDDEEDFSNSQNYTRVQTRASTPGIYLATAERSALRSSRGTAATPLSYSNRNIEKDSFVNRTPFLTPAPTPQMRPATSLSQHYYTAASPMRYSSFPSSTSPEPVFESDLETRLRLHVKNAKRAMHNPESERSWSEKMKERYPAERRTLPAV